MYPSLRSQERKRTLRQDDINAIIAAYPQAQVTPTSTPTPVPTVGTLPFSILAPGIARD
jgi:hypothetical protein